MNRRELFVICLGVSVNLTTYEHWRDSLWAGHGVVRFAFECLSRAALTPVIRPVGLFNRYVLGIDPEGGRGLAIILLAAALFWFFPYGRIVRAFGAYNPFAGSDRPRPRLLRAAASLLDVGDKLRFGRQKTGGWS